MRAKLIGSIGLWLTAAGLAIGDEPKVDRTPQDEPVPTKRDEPEKPKLLQPPGAAELIQVPPSATDTWPTPSQACQPHAQQDGRARAEQLRDDHLGPSHILWANLDYLYWWTKDGPLPAPLLVTDGTVLIGGRDFSYGDSPGGRLTVGVWLDELHHFGVEASGFLLPRNRAAATVSSDADGNPTLSRPILDASALPNFPPTPINFIVSQPERIAGSLAVSSQSRFWGAEANLVRNLVCECDYEMDLMLGFRYLDLDEDLNIDQNSDFLFSGTISFAGNPTDVTPSTSLTLTDQFTARNNLYLVQAGGRASLRGGPVSIDVLWKLGFGPNHEQILIDGASQLTNPNAAAAGGLLALAGTNIGRTRTYWLSVVPEVGAQFGWQLTHNLKLHVGYSVLYINSVVRPGEQINQRVNTAFLPTDSNFGTLTAAPPEPSLLFHRTDYWVHGINAGVALRF
jgi:hypothetical protein